MIHSWEVIRRVLTEDGRSIKEIADAMSAQMETTMPAARLEAWTRPPGKKPRAASPREKKAHSLRINPLARIDGLIRHTGDFAYLDWLAVRSGGIWIHPHTGSPDRRSRSIKVWYDAWTQIHALRGEIKGAFEDDEEFDSEEVNVIALRWLAVQRWIEGVVVGFDGRSFRTGEVGTNPEADLLPDLPAWAVFLHSIKGLKQNFRKASGASAIEKRLADQIHLSWETVRNWRKRPANRQSGKTNPLDECLALMGATRSDLPLRWLASRWDGLIVPNTSKGAPKDPLKEWMNTHLELAELECALGRYFLEDKEISGKNAAVFVKEWDDVKRCMPLLIQAIAKSARSRENRRP